MNSFEQKIKQQQSLQRFEVEKSVEGTVAFEVNQDILKGTDWSDILTKAKSGVYSNTAQNRKLGRVGQKYGSEKQEDKIDLSNYKDDIQDVIDKKKTWNSLKQEIWSDFNNVPSQYRQPEKAQKIINAIQEKIRKQPHLSKQSFYESVNKKYGTNFKVGDIDEFEDDEMRKQLTDEDIKDIVDAEKENEKLDLSKHSIQELKDAIAVRAKHGVSESDSEMKQLQEELDKRIAIKPSSQDSPFSSKGKALQFQSELPPTKKGGRNVIKYEGQYIVTTGKRAAEYLKAGALWVRPNGEEVKIKK